MLLSNFLIKNLATCIEVRTDLITWPCCGARVWGWNKTTENGDLRNNNGKLLTFFTIFGSVSILRASDFYFTRKLVNKAGMWSLKKNFLISISTYKIQAVRVNIRVEEKDPIYITVTL